MPYSRPIRTSKTPLPDQTGRIGQYVGGNEQSCHIAYLYNYAGAPDKTQYWVRQAMTQLYGDTPASEPGNVDCGEMAAWYVFSALGLYPVNPGSGIYIIGSPVVSKAVIHLDNDKYHGRTFTIIADNNSPNNVYIQSVTLNGKPLTRSWITRDEITAGGTLHFVMGHQPSHQWGNALADRPPATMPADFQYPPLPDPAPVGQTIHFSLPIRIVCGSDDPVAGFLPDPDVVNSAENSADATVDTSAPNSAPATVYKTERYGSDFSYIIPVPKDGNYLVRLHFAEVFDNAAGDRVENISINGQSALTNFDIYVAAGGMNKAVIKDFPNIAPDEHGNITIRFTATPDSPDQNAKITAIEILKPDSTSATFLAPFDITTVDGKTTIAIDTSAAPELAGWASHKLAPVLAEWYPKIVALLPSPGFTAPTHYTITVKDMDGVAYTTGTEVSVSKKWIQDQMNGEAVGSLVHESVHVVQQYHFGHVPGWLVEGMADYVRWFKYEPQSHGADIVWMRKRGTRFSPHYDDSYRVSANFLNWVSEKYDSSIVTKVNAAAREGKYTRAFWKEATGKTIDELGAEWGDDIKAQLQQASAGN